MFTAGGQLSTIWQKKVTKYEKLKYDQLDEYAALAALVTGHVSSICREKIQNLRIQNTKIQKKNTKYKKKVALK